MVTSGASQGPHAALIWCLFVCLCHAWHYPVSVPYRTVPSNTVGYKPDSWPQYLLAPSRICPVPYHQTQPATNSSPQYSSYYVYDSLMYREIFWKEIGRRGGNAIILDVSCRIGDRMRQQKDKKHTLEERSRRLQNKR